MHPLTIFAEAFPFRLQFLEGELRYPIKRQCCATAYRYAAWLMIKAMRLPLIPAIDVWSSRDKVLGVELVIRMAPEQDLIERAFPDHSLSPADEVPGEEELNSIWSFEEREQYDN